MKRLFVEGWFGGRRVVGCNRGGGLWAGVCRWVGSIVSLCSLSFLRRWERLGGLCIHVGGGADKAVGGR